MITDINTKDTKLIWKIAFPFILGSLWQPVIGILNTYVVGHLENENFLASLAYGNSIIHPFYWIFGSVGMAITGFTSQKKGLNEKNKILRILNTSIMFMIIASTIIIIFQSSLWNIYSYIYDQNPIIENLTKNYYSISILGIAPQLIIVSSSSWFLGIKKPKKIFQIWSVLGISHILSIYIFTYYYDLKLIGIAYSTVISQWLTLVFLIFQVVITLKDLKIKFFIGFLSKLEILFLGKSFLNLFVRTFMLQSIYIVGTYVSTNLGSTILATYGLFLQMISVSYLTIDGPTLGSSPLIGESFAEKNIYRLKTIYKNAFLSGIMTALLFSLIFLIFGNHLINTLTDIESVRMESYKYIYLVGFLPILSAWSFQLDGAFSGMLKTKEMRDTMIISAIVYFIAIFSITNFWGNYGVWIAYLFFALTRGISLNYHMNKILNKIQINEKH